MTAQGQNLRDRYAIVGTGKSRLGKVPDLSSHDLTEEAMHAAVADAGLAMKDIDGLLCRGPDTSYTFHQEIGERLGINARFSTTTCNGGASQILSVIQAVMAIEAGMCTTVLCGYGRDAWSRTHKDEATRIKGQTRGDDMLAKEFGPEYGYFSAAATHALGARRHMHVYGTKRAQFGAIATSFRAHAVKNPEAMMQKPLSLDEYLAARMIVDPFGLYDCSLRSDAAGAVIVTSMERARDLDCKPVAIKGFGTFNNLSGWFEDDNMIRTGAAKSGAAAYAMAGVGPEDIDTAQIYDCFTYMVLVQLEDYGFCKKGEGGDFVASGALAPGGKLPTNTSGGQLSESHAEGMLQIVEGARQLQGIYGPDRQVKDAELALVSGHGGNTVCHSSLILGRA